MTASSSMILQARGLGRTVAAPEGELQILNNIDLDVETGSSLAVVGSSGSGKSTLLGLLAGLDQPSVGTVKLDGRELNNMSEDQRARWRAGRVGFVFQSFHLLPSMNAQENVMLALELADDDKPRERAAELLEAVGLGHRLRHYPRQLSGGEQQRVALARAFAGRPRLLFADEPTGNLDEKTGDMVAAQLFAMQAEQRTTLVLVTHDRELAARCDRCLTMHAGHLEGES